MINKMWLITLTVIYASLTIIGAMVLVAVLTHSTDIQKACKDYTDARIEERIRFFRDSLMYEVDGHALSTNDVLLQIIDYFGIELEYLPLETIPGRVVIHDLKATGR